MYLDHFGFHCAPFSLTPNTELFLGLAPHYEAVHTVLAAVKMGEGVIKVTGEVGTGKTMVCRMVIEQIQDDVQLIYLPNPALNGYQLQQAVASELGIESMSPTSIVADIQLKLVESFRRGQPALLVVDEAQALSEEALETLRLFGNLETEHTKLLQLILFGQPELDEKLAQQSLRQFRQRITFNSILRPLEQAEAIAYLTSRIEKCGGDTRVISEAQMIAIWKSARGIPRIMNQLCHKSLLLAFHQNSQSVTDAHVFDAMHDTIDARKPRFKSPKLWGWKNS